MAKVRKQKRRVEDLSLNDFLISINRQLTIPDPKKCKEAQDLYYSGQLTKYEVNQYLAANFN